MTNQFKEVPDGFVLLQRTNGKASHAACMTGRFAGWLMCKHPDGQWVSDRKLEPWELMQAEDQRDDGIVHEVNQEAAPAPQQSEALSDDQWIFDLAAEHEANRNGLYGPVTFDATGLVDFARAIERESRAKAAPAAPVQTAEPMSEHARWTIKQAADALAYVAYNYDGSKLEDLKPGIVESTGAAETALIAERNLRDLLSNLAAPVQAEQAQAEPIYQVKSLIHSEFWHDTDWHSYEWNKENKQEVRIVYATPVAALPAQAEQAAAVREAALEEAAQVCKPALIQNATAYEIAAIRKCAENIRALAAPSTATSNDTGALGEKE